jgi:triacylglycerol lipase
MLRPAVAHVLALAAALAGSGCSGDLAGGVSGDGFRWKDLAPPDDGGTLEYADPPPDLALGRAGPPYPIVLVHGMAGFRNIGPIDYFYDIPAALRMDGHDVWVSRQDPINDSEARGAQVLAFVQTVLAATGKAKVDLIAHSQGGFDARYVASALGDRVATVVTIATPHAGDPVADVALANTGPVSQAVLAALLDLYGAASGLPSDARAQVATLTAAGAKAFFARHPDDARVAYYSIAGRSQRSAGGDACAAPGRPDFVSRWDGALDPLDPLFLTFAAVLDAQSPAPVHDGLVPVGSAVHGTFLGCIPADHMDEVNQLFGDSPGLGNPFDAVAFYRGLAAWLVARGD